MYLLKLSPLSFIQIVYSSFDITFAFTKYLFDIDRISDFNYSFHLENNLYKYDSAIPKLLEDKNKFNQLTFFNFAEQSQSAINYHVKNFFKTNTEIMTQVDYPSDIEISVKESDDGNF